MPILFKRLRKVGAFSFVHFDNPYIYAYGSSTVVKS